MIIPLCRRPHAHLARSHEGADVAGRPAAAAVLLQPPADGETDAAVPGGRRAPSEVRVVQGMSGARTCVIVVVCGWPCV